MSETALVEAINKEAFDFVGLISEREKIQPTGVTKHVFKGTVAERNMVDMSDRIDGTGIATGINESEKPSTISLETKEKSYSLNSKHFPRFQSFVKKILSAKQFKDVASEDFIGNRAFKWIMDVYVNKKPSSLLSEYLNGEVEANVKPYRFYFSVLNLEIEQPFRLGNVEFMYFTREDMNEMYAHYIAMPIVREKTMTEEEFKNTVRVKYQGRVLVKVEVTAEYDKAEEIARDHASLAVDILKLFWATVLVPEQRTMFDLDYRLNYQVATHYISEEVNKKDDRCLGVKFNNPYSDLTPEHLAFVFSNGLNEFSNFIMVKKDDELHGLIIQAINFMANTLSTWDLHFRCISIITTLESLLLKDEERSKSKLVKQRLLAIVANGDVERKRAEEAFAHVYNVRHDMVHKAKRADIDMQKLSEVQFIMVHLLRGLINININGKIFNKADFIDGIPTKKIMMNTDEAIEIIKDMLVNGLITDVFNAERYNMVYKTLCDNAPTLNESEIDMKTFFSIIQGMSQDACILGLARAFDKPSQHNQTRSLPCLLQKLRELAGSLPKVEEDALTLKLLKQYNLPQSCCDSVKDSDSSKFPIEIATYYESLCSDNKSLREFRNKFIAHNDATKGQPTLSWNKFEELANLAKQVIEILQMAYFSSMFQGVISRDAERNAISTEAILRRLGVIQDIDITE